MDRLVLNHVTYRYPIAEENALNDVSLRIKEGEFCSIIGANGSGKTTLCTVIRGFIPKFYQGDLGSLATEVGFVFQNPFTQISGIANTVFEELAFGLENMGVEPDVIRRRVEDVLRLTKTEEFRDRNPYQLSGGQQQRIALAAILIMEQDIMVIDEPTSQLDPQSTDDVFEVIKLMKDVGRTIVLVEHKMEQIARYSDHIVVLDQGRVVLEGAPRDVITNPDCAQYHTRLPQCTNIGLGLKERGVDLGGLPITNDEAAAQIRNYMGR